ncbi:hypothetical protein [Stutzerimonas stutzeri]|uniref:hypothetical protein n=1 Tax=Stutzerimonas stutzeri TaxID=316 RepID=UPI00210DFDC7|nr:hypothetical protein [Stutzerimonas stutzeri]MCQ4240086.1 hypothetical protein [Stutzerimonas stutzeri]
MRGSFVVENHSGAHDSYSRIGIPYKRFTTMAICLLDQAGKPYFQRSEQLFQFVTSIFRELGDSVTIGTPASIDALAE